MGSPYKPYILEQEILMLVKTITYKDFNGVEQSEKFYFNLTEAEVAEIELSTDGGFAEKIERIVAAEDQKEIWSVFKELILMSVGEKSPDGKHFIKSPEIRARFEQSAAYSALIMEMLTGDASVSQEFFNGIIPKVKEQPPTA